MCVNALYRASPISTHCYCLACGHEYDCVNALYRASPISTNKDNARKKITFKCVNALYRASPISTLKLAEDTDKYILCQCPVSGFSHFYGIPSKTL